MKEEFKAITPILNRAITNNKKLHKEVMSAYERFKAGDLGNTCEEDVTLAGNGDRIVARYNTSIAPIFIINSSKPYGTAEDGSVIFKRGNTLMYRHEYQDYKRQL